jgi:lipopolysaccharide biosynthesis glycosyltransferase
MMIACAVDEPYAEMAGVMLRSLSIKGDVRDMPVYLVGDGLGIEVVRDLHECATDLDFHFVDLAAMRAKISNLPASFYNPAIYIRLLLPDLIEGDGRILYLDSDILINGPIRDLLLTPLDGNIAAAVIDGGLPTIHAMANARLGRAENAPYFNSGVLMFDLQTWRAQGIGPHCIRTAETRNDYWPDQDALNIVLDGKIKALDAKWNLFSTQPLPREICEMAHILHFIPDKPTSENCRHPMFEDYLAIRATTPWRDRPFTSSIRQRRVDQLSRTVAERVRRKKLDRM